jgi:isoquinoline 1-oxidoreductase beta subunit
MVLMQAAANQWQVPVAELRVDKGVVQHTASGRSTTYGKLADAAAKLPAPDAKSITLKNPRDWKLVGKPLKRLDTAPKVTGQQKYAIDVALPGMLIAAIKASPVFGGKLVSFDASKVLGLRGIKSVVKVDDASVAVIADSFWRAKQALEKLPIV